MISLKQNFDFAGVYCAAIPFSEQLMPIYSELRAAEISAARNPKVREQKFYVWQLLGYALKDFMGIDIKNISFSHEKDGKWTCGECFFSLSHTDGFVAVIVSCFPCGVDIEIFSPEKFKNSLAKKILTQAEYYEYLKLDDIEKNEYAAFKWTQKESIFKMVGAGTFVPKNIETYKFYEYTETKTFVTENKRYIVSAVTDRQCKKSFFSYGGTAYDFKN